jgi:hypothetical protein
MIRRWHHGHSILAGLAAGAALTQGVWGAVLLFGGGFVLGLIASFAWRLVRSGVDELLALARRKRDGRVTMRTWRRARRRLYAIRPDDEIPF